jgi:hypothetical protein
MIVNFVIVELFISTSTCPHVVQRTSSPYGVGHSWEDYIYSPPTRYTVLLPFVISKISTVLSVLDVHRFCPILNPLTIKRTGHSYESRCCDTYKYVCHIRSYTPYQYIKILRYFLFLYTPCFRQTVFLILTSL